MANPSLPPLTEVERLGILPLFSGQDHEEVGMAFRLLAVMVICSLGFTSIAGDKPKDDTQLMQGTWYWDEDAAKSLPNRFVIFDQVDIKGDVLTFHYKYNGEKIVTPTKFKLDPDASPKTINYTPIENSTTGMPFLGLYELKDGKLKICYRGPESTRPKNFDDSTTEKLGGTVYIVLKRSPAK